jgi:hypothetical protein
VRRSDARSLNTRFLKPPRRTTDKSIMRPEDDINRSHLSGAAPATLLVAGPARGAFRGAAVAFSASDSAGRPALPPPYSRPLSPRRQKLQYVLVGWVLGLLTYTIPIWISTALHTR